MHSPDRLLHPLVRTGPKGRGPVPARELGRGHRARGGALAGDRGRPTAARPSSPTPTPARWALVQRNAGHAFFHALGASRLERTICTPAQGRGRGGGDGEHARPATRTTVHDADLVVLWGINAVATNVHFVQRVKEARRRGARVWSRRDLRTATAAGGRRTVLVRPGTDGALALGLVHVLARDGLADEGFLAREAVGWPALRARALADYPPERVAATDRPRPRRDRGAGAGPRPARAPFIRAGRRAVALRQRRHDRAAHRLPGGGARRATTAGAAAAWSRRSIVGAFDLAPFTRPDLLARPTRAVNMNRLGWALTELAGSAGPARCTSGAPTPPRWHRTRTRCCAASPARTSSWWCTSGS